MMKRKMMMAVGLLALAQTVFAAAKLVDGYVDSATVTLGQWNYNFDAVKAYADAQHVPLLMFYGSTSCGYCDGMIRNGLNSDVFRDWVKEHPICMVFQDKSSLSADAAKAFVKDGQPGRELPYMKIYWLKSDGTKVNKAFPGRKGEMPSKVGSERGEQLVNSLNLLLADYFTPQTPKARFAMGVTNECHRLESEDATRSVVVPLVREGNVTVASVDTLWANDKQIATIAWATNQVVTNVAVAVNKATVKLVVKNADAAETDSTAIVYRPDLEVSAANPLWVGEAFGFGAWTCDIDGAKALVSQTDGAAYTLVSIQGSMWCPDCANTDRNFLDVTDDKGNNRFQAWAKAHNVALVSMDIPNYTGAAVTDYATPTLFSTNAYATTLARPKEYPQSGADGKLTNAIVRSGLGYLSRKGVTAEQAAATLKKFHDLAVTNTDKGGFHRPEDMNKNRTGVPIFVLLRKDGSVAARFTRFASVSPMAADKANFDNYLKRFEEMLALADATGDYADATEIENNYPGEGAIAFRANGGSVSNTLSHADMQDAFKLVGVGGNADQKVTVRGADAAEVSVQFWQKSAEGAYEVIGDYVTGTLAEGVTLTHTFTEGGDYYLLVKGLNITNAAFDAASATANHFHAYTVAGATVLVPQGDQVKANAPEGCDTVIMRLEAGKIYCFSGVNAADNPDTFEQTGTMGAYAFLKAKVSGDVEVKIANGVGGEICYQLWQPGEVGFMSIATNVLESVNDRDNDWVEFQVARTVGKSGAIKARVTVDAEKTTLLESRYVFETNALNAVDLIWEDGDTSNRTVRVHIEDDLFYEGAADLVFNLEVLASSAGDVKVADGKAVYTLTVEEDDKSEPGRGIISRTTPAPAPDGTLYVRESEGAKIWVERIEACDGLVIAELSSTAKDTTFETEDPRDMTNILGRTGIYWSSREMTEKQVTVKGIEAGEKAYVQLKSVGDFKTVAGSNAVTIVALADDAPAFVETEKHYAIYRYVTVADVTVGVDEKSLAGGEVTFKKIMGTIPSGLKAVWDEEKSALAFTGTPTKSGSYVASYQIYEKRGSVYEPGTVATVYFEVTDPTDAVHNPEGANPAVAKTRTLTSLPVMSGTRLAGLLQLTITQKGKISAKYTCAVGSIAFSSKSWGTFDPETKALAANLDCRVAGYTLHVAVAADGAVGATITDPEYETDLKMVMDWDAWSSTNPATEWKGYYTVACPVDEELIVESVSNLTSRGCGYVTLKMDTTSAAKSGKVKWAGVLPNGTSVSGSSLLAKAYTEEDGKWVNLPLFKVASRDVFSSYVRILANAQENEVRRCVLAAKDDSKKECDTKWLYVGANTAASYLADLNVYGSYYDKAEDLGGCCDEYFQTHNLVLSFDTSKLGWTSGGTPRAITPVDVVVGSSTLKIDSDENPSNIKLSFKRATGIVSGSANLSYADDDGTVRVKKVTYKGVILTGWGEGCGCGDFDVYRPFVNGSYYFKDAVEAATVMRGGAVSMDAPTK